MIRTIEASPTKRRHMSQPHDHLQQGFQDFYQNQWSATVRLTRLLTSRTDLAEDLAQDAFVRVYRYTLHSERPIDNPAALLRTSNTTWHDTEPARTSSPNGTANSITPSPDFPTTSVPSSCSASGSGSTRRKSPAPWAAAPEPSSPGYHERSALSERTLHEPLRRTDHR